MKSTKPRLEPRSSRVRARLAWALALLIALLPSSWGWAQEPAAPLTPPDVMRVEGSLLPKLPAGFVEERVNTVTWAFHESDSSIARELQGKLPERIAHVVRELGVEPSTELTIRIARGPKDMVSLTPKGAPPPEYAVGVAYPALGLIVLSVVSPGSWFPPDLEGVLTHELSHVLLFRAVNGHALPLWFVEGLAVHQAGEQNLARVRTLWEAAVVGEVLPLSALSRQFPTHTHEVNRAYAQSADLVEHMLGDPSDRAKLPTLLTAVAEGKTFEDAVLTAYHINLSYLDREWRQALAERFRVLPLVLTGTALWGGIAILAVFAFIRRRRDHHEKLRRWAEEEAAHERAMAALELQRQASFREEIAAQAGYLLPPSIPRESGVPTVEHEGQRYTLH